MNHEAGKRLLVPGVALCILSSIAVTGWVPTAVAQDMDDDWAQAPRVVTVATSFEGFTITSTRDDGNGNDTITWTFWTANSTLLSSFSSTDPDNQTGPDLRLHFYALLEYEDLDGDGRLSLADRVVKPMPWRDMLYPFIRYEGGRDGVHTVYVRYTMPDLMRGTVELYFTARERATNGTQEAATATSLGLRSVIERFPFQGGDNHSLAVDARLNPAPRLANDHVALQKGQILSRLAWNNTAEGDGEPAPVTVTMQRYSGSGPSQALLAFSLPAARHVEHDGRIVLERMVPPDPDRFVPEIVSGKILGEWRVFSVGLLLAVVAIGGATYPRLRRRW